MGGYIFVDREKEGKRSMMREEMRRNYRNYNHGGKSYDDGYREGYKDGREDGEHGWNEDGYRQERDSRGRYM